MSNEECFECGFTDEIHQHHVVPKVKGGTKTIPLCSTCHSLVHGRNMLDHGNLVSEGLRRAKKQGILPGSKPYGHFESEKPLIKRLNELRYNRRPNSQGGYRDIFITEILYIINSEGFRTRTQTPFSITQLRRIFKQQNFY